MGLIGSKKYANLEIQDYVIRYAEVKNNKKSFTITQCDEHYFPKGVIEGGKVLNEEIFVRTLKHCIRKWNLKGKNIRFIVPDSSVILRTVEIPADIQDEEIKGHIYFELGHSIHLPFENPVLDAVSLGMKGDMKQVLVVASSEENVDTFYDHMKEEKLDIVAADVSSLCQYRLYHKFNMTNDNDIFMLTQFNVKAVTISIFEQHKPVFMQQIEIPYPEEAWKVVPLHSGGYLSRAQFDRKKVMLAFDDVFTEIERIIRFYQYSLNNGEKQINRMLLTGDHPYLEELLDGSKERFGLPINILPPDEINAAKNLEVSYNFYNVIGLAMKEGE
jgi:type IV pilus assembly protein PilM